MNDTEVNVACHPSPCNSGKRIGLKPPLKLREICALRTDGRWLGRPKNSPCSTWRSTASSGGATSCSYE